MRVKTTGTLGCILLNQSNGLVSKLRAVIAVIRYPNMAKASSSITKNLKPYSGKQSSFPVWPLSLKRRNLIRVLKTQWLTPRHDKVDTPVMKKMIKGFLVTFSVLCSVSTYGAFRPDSYNIYEANVDGNSTNDLVFIAKEKLVLVGTEVLTPITYYDGKSFTALSNGNGGYTISYSHHGTFDTNSHSPTTKYSVLNIDLNQDGKDDLLLKPGSGSIVQVHADNSGTAPSTVVAQGSFAGLSNVGLSVKEVNLDSGRALLLAKGGVSWLVDGSGNAFNPTRPHMSVNAVGSLKGDFTVSQGGSAAYHLPIDLTPGPGQKQPNVSVNYDSQSGNGLLGMGWSLGAAEQISRCQSKEPGSASVSFTASDTLCLNGDELVYSHNAESDKIYRKKIDDGTLVRVTGTNTYGPTKLKVYSEGGTIKEFGYTSDSQTVKSGHTAIRKWYLNKVYWLGGASYTLKYSENEKSGEVLLTQIDYGVHNVRFAYEERPDRNFGYQSGGVWFGQTKRLKSITTNLDNSSVFNYTFFYGYNARKDASYLESIQKCTGAECLEPLAFNWNLPQDGFISSTSYSPELESGHDDHFQMADVNGDGISDLVSQESGYEGNNNNIKIYKHLGREKNSKIPFYDIGVATSDSETKKSSLHLNDIDSDGIADIVWHNGEKIQNAVSNELFSWANKVWEYNTKDGQSVSLNDVNGDGIDDLINYGKFGTIYTHAGKVGGGFGAASETLFAISMQSHAFGDVNGDGKADLLIYPTVKGHSKGVLGVRLGQGTPNASAGFSGFLAGKSLEIGRPDEENVNLSLMDVNGDGLSDLFVTIIREDANSTAFDTHKTFYYLADGTGGFNSTPVATFNYNRALPQHFIDINGDGRIDRLVGNQYQLAGRDGVFGSPQTWSANLAPYTYRKENKDTLIRDVIYNVLTFHQDIDGNGSNDLVVIKENKIYSTTNDYTNTSYNEVNVLKGRDGSLHIESIANSMDEDINIFYASMLDSSVYTPVRPSKSEAGIGLSLSSKTWLVKEAQSPEGQTYFKYGGAQYSTKEGYLGFQVFTSVTDRVTDDAIISSGRQAVLAATYLHQSKHLAGKQYEVYKRVFEAGQDGSAASIVNSGISFLTNSEGNLYADYDGRKLYDGKVEPYYDGFSTDRSGTGSDSSTTDYASTYDILWEVRPLNNGIVRPVISKESTTFFDPTHTGTQGDGKVVNTVTVENSWETVDQGRYVRRTGVVTSRGANKVTRTTTRNNYSYLSDSMGSLNEFHKLFLLTGFTESISAGGDWATDLSGQELITAYTANTTNDYNANGQLEWTQKNIVSLNTDQQPPGRHYTYNSMGDVSIESVRSKKIWGEIYSSTAFVYDEETGFLLKKTDAELNATEYSNHDNFGNPGLESRQNLRGGDGSPALVAYWLDTNKNYDKWGRLIREERPTGEVVDINYARCTAASKGCLNNDEYSYYKSVKSNQGEEYRYYDERGLETKVVKSDYKSGYVGFVQRYDAHNRLIKKSVPTKIANLAIEPDAASSHSYRYNITDSVVYKKRANGFTTETAYSYPLDGTIKKTITETISEGESRTTVEWYDALNRLIKVKQPNGSYTQYLYDLNDNWVRSWFSKPDYSEASPEANTADDRANSFVVIRDYDLRGRMLSEVDPNKGTITYTYTALDDVKTVIDANEETTSYKYDKLGRKTAVNGTEGTICYYYDKHVTNYSDRYLVKNFWATGKLIETRQFTRNLPCYQDGHWQTGATNISHAWIRRVSYEYDSNGQLKYQNQDMAMAGQHDADYNYDEKGRLLQKVHPGGSFSTQYEYDSFSGKLASVKDSSTGVVYRKIDSYSVFGEANDEWLGDKIQVKRTFDSTTGRQTGMLTYSDGTLVLDTANQYDSEGKLTRYDEKGVNLGSTAVSDYFARYRYEDMAKQQLTSVDTTESVGQYSYLYDALGNIRKRSDVSYSYDESFPHRVTSAAAGSYSYDAAGSVTSDGKRVYQYQAEQRDYKPKLKLTDPVFDLGSRYSDYKVGGHLPAQITQGDRITQYIYGPDDSVLLRRDVRTYRPTGITGAYGTHIGEKLAEETELRDTWYFEGMKLLRTDSSRERLFDVTSGVEVTLKNSNGSTRFIQYKVANQQGSVLLTLNSDGVVKQRLRYKPFGSTEVIYNADISLTGEVFTWDDLTSEEGYTDHNTLSDLDLIHMGGRVYDPALGRFLQGDIIVQNRAVIGSFNRYSYVLNNPAFYTDPSGYARVKGAESPSSLSDIEPTDSAKFHTANPIKGPADRKVRKEDRGLGGDGPGVSEQNIEPKRWYHKLGEKIRGTGVLVEIDKRKQIIEQVAKDQDVDPKLIRAIIYEEMTHQLPFENEGELLGKGTTFGLGQVTDGYYGLDSKQLWDPQIGINAIGRHLKSIQSQPLIEPDSPIQSISTRYNCGDCTSITNYGRRVHMYMEQF